MYELAEALHMPVGELGTRMSNYELNVGWPAFYAYRQRQRQAAEEAQRHEQRRLG